MSAVCVAGALSLGRQRHVPLESLRPCPLPFPLIHTACILHPDAHARPQQLLFCKSSFAVLAYLDVSNLADPRAPLKARNLMKDSAHSCTPTTNCSYPGCGLSKQRAMWLSSQGDSCGSCCWRIAVERGCVAAQGLGGQVRLHVHGLTCMHASMQNSCKHAGTCSCVRAAGLMPFACRLYVRIKTCAQAQSIVCALCTSTR